LPVTVVTKMVYCVKAQFSLKGRGLKNLDTGKGRVLLFANFVFYMSYRNVENRSFKLFRI
jgi:hypothetical protein